uniref:Uncharacterized protein n=1 Tax=viral metagenome TaxID=1070528 RepID=A0A6C0BFN0_9ZZZZ
MNNLAQHFGGKPQVQIELQPRLLTTKYIIKLFKGLNI